MTKEEYIALIDWSGFKRKIAIENITCAELERKIGLYPKALHSLASYSKVTPNVEIIAKLCAYFKCSLDDLVVFNGYDIKPEFKGMNFEPYEPAEEGPYLTYEPMYSLFLSKYGVTWRGKMDEFFSTVQPYEKSEKLKKSLEEKNNKNFGYSAKEKGSTNRVHKGGLNTGIRSHLRHNEPVDMRTIYEICKALGCTPGCIIGYKKLEITYDY